MGLRVAESRGEPQRVYLEGRDKPIREDRELISFAKRDRNLTVVPARTASLRARL